MSRKLVRIVAFAGFAAALVGAADLLPSMTGNNPVHAEPRMRAASVTAVQPMAPYYADWQDRLSVADDKQDMSDAALAVSIDPDLIDLNDELQCLAMNIYHEARGESSAGRMAVAHVTLNRAASPRFPDNICDVVKQGGETRRHRCQFSWWCDGKSDRPKDSAAWEESVFAAITAMTFGHDDVTGDALFYHADYVNPYWAGKMTRTGRIGRHIFYRDEPKS